MLVTLLTLIYLKFYILSNVPYYSTIFYINYQSFFISKICESPRNHSLHRYIIYQFCIICMCFSYISACVYTSCINKCISIILYFSTFYRICYVIVCNSLYATRTLVPIKSLHSPLCIHKIGYDDSFLSCYDRTISLFYYAS